MAIWKTWRQWTKMGREDAIHGREAKYIHQLDYMNGYYAQKNITKKGGG